MSAIAHSLTLKKDLSFNGSYGFRVHGDRITLTVQQINNHRSFDNLSGTVAIELRGYRQDGAEAVLASTTIGQFSGQHYLSNCEYDLIFTAPEAGQWQLALELREWNGSDYELIDSQPFDVPYVVAWQPTVVEPTVTPTTKEKVVSIEEAPTTPVSKPVKSKKPTEQDKAPKAKKTAPEKEDSGLISINQSSLEELASVKGMPKKVAKEIVEKRPHTSWEALLKIKGMGPRMLKKLKKALKLD